MSEYLDLSFVTERPGRLQGLNFWDFEPSGDYVEDWGTGELLGLEALEFMAKRSPDSLPGAYLLASVVLDMPRGDDRTGLELGFLNCIANFAMIARSRFGDKHYRDYLEQRRLRVREMIAQDAANRSEQGRKAARARWAKRDRERLSAGSAS